MKQLKQFILICSIIITMSGCAYTNIRIPLDTSLEKTQLGSKVGKSSTYSVMWLAAWGDSSYAKAAKDGNLKVMNHSDVEIQQYLFGLFVKETTIVYGD